MGHGTKLTRRELYDLVWATPMTKLAQQFGISDVGLKKTCDRHRVPTPPRGYWAQIEAGQKPKKAVFVEVDDVWLNQIEVGTYAHKLPEPLRLLVEEQRAERKQRVEKERAPKAIVESAPVRDVHPVIKATAKALRAITARAETILAGAPRMCGVEVGRASIERAIVILDQLARAFDERGLALTPTGSGMCIKIGSDEAILRLIERIRTIDHAPTAEEIEAEARRQKRLARTWGDESSWVLGRYDRAYPEKDIIRTGHLSIQIEGYSDGVRRTWADGKTQRVEDLIPSIVDGTEVLLAARKLAREEREAHARKWADAQRRRHLAQKRKEREAARLEFFEGLISLGREAATLRARLSEISHLSNAGNASIDRMMRWGAARLADLDARLTLRQIEKAVTDAGLFPAEGEDELFDPLGDPSEGTYW